MFAFRPARSRASGRRVKAVSVLILAGLLAACSSSKQPAGPQVFAWLAPEPPPPPPAVAADIEFEDDGLPVQAPPSAAIRHIPDDPTAPWSPNYGRSGVGAEGAAAAQRTPSDDRWPAATTDDAADAGLPAIRSPEEAGVVVPKSDRLVRGAALSAPGAACSAGVRWKCVR